MRQRQTPVDQRKQKYNWQVLSDTGMPSAIDMRSKNLTNDEQFGTVKGIDFTKDAISAAITQQFTAAFTDIETLSQFEQLATAMGKPQTNSSTSMEFLEGPWRRIHVDYVGPFQGESFLIVVDAYSKWPEVVAVDDTTTDKTVDELRAIFAQWEVPLQMVMDNGPQIILAGFEIFLASNNIKHVRFSPYHPATNGLAERFVQTLKHALRVSKGDEHTPQY